MEKTIQNCFREGSIEEKQQPSALTDDDPFHKFVILSESALDAFPAGKLRKIPYHFIKILLTQNPSQMILRSLKKFTKKKMLKRMMKIKFMISELHQRLIL